MYGSPKTSPIGRYALSCWPGRTNMAKLAARTRWQSVSSAIPRSDGSCSSVSWPCRMMRINRTKVSIWRFSFVVRLKVRFSTRGERQNLRRQKMKYLLLIYHNEKEWAAHTEAEVQKVYEEYGQLR